MANYPKTSLTYLNKKKQTDPYSINYNQQPVSGGYNYASPYAKQQETALNAITNRAAYSNPYEQQTKDTLTSIQNASPYKSAYDTQINNLLSTLSGRKYTSPYATQIQSSMSKIQNRPSFSYDPNSDVGLQAAQDEAQAAVSRAASRRGMLYSDSNKAQMGKSALALIPQFRGQAFNEYQGEGQNLFNTLNALNSLENTAYGQYQGEGADLYNQFNAYNALDNTAYNRYQGDLENKRGLLNVYGNLADTAANAYNTETNRLNTNYNTVSNADQNAYERYVADVNRKDTMAEKEKQDYIKSIAGLGNQFDYQAEINKLGSDNDPSNDWQIPYLQQEREKKIQTNLQNDISTIGRYGDNYQAEINKRAAINPNDPLIPYLTIARQQKISNQAAAQAEAEQQAFENNLKYTKNQADIYQSRASGDAALMNAQTSAARLALDKSKNEYDKAVAGDPNKYDLNLYKQIDDYIGNYLSQSEYTTDAEGKSIKTGKTTRTTQQRQETANYLARAMEKATNDKELNTLRQLAVKYDVVGAAQPTSSGFVSPSERR